MSFAYHVGKDLVINGVEIIGEINTAVTDYKAGKWGDFGFQVGEALAKVLIGSEQQLLEKKAVDAAKSLAIAKGILEGALEAEDLDNMDKCLLDSEAVIAQAEKTYEDFSKISLKGTADGVKDIAKLLTLIENDMQYCKNVDADWVKLKNMVSIFQHPMSLVYHIGKDLSVNGIEIFTEVKSAITDYQSSQWEEFGINVGKATAKTILGMERQYMDKLTEELDNGNTAAVETLGYLF